MEPAVNETLIIGIIISMLFSAFFSGMEIAFVSSNRMLLEIDKDRSGLTQKILSTFYHLPNLFVGTMLVGNNISLVVFGILIGSFFDQTLFAGYEAAFTVPADTILSTIIVLFAGEFIPKTIFKNNPNRLISLFAIPCYFIYIVLWPISRFATFFSHQVLNIMGVKEENQADSKGFTKVELNYLLRSSMDNATQQHENEEEVKFFQNVLDFKETKVRDCMIPRTEIKGVNINDCTTDNLKQRFIETGHSKLLVYREDMDHIIGYIHSAEMFRNHEDWTKAIQKMPFVPETMPAQKLMQIFLQQKKSLGVVVDEYGGTGGIVSLEDIVEEILGDIEDEHDNSSYVARQTKDGNYLLSARLEIDKVNEMFGLDIPESDDYMTVGGYILNHYQKFPKLNEVIKIDRFEIKILKSTMTRIELISLKIDSDTKI